MPTPDHAEVQRHSREARTRELNRLNHLKRRALQMGLNLNDFYAALGSPPLCEACGVQTSLGERVTGTDLTFDHSHVTGKFRGFLCRRDNLILGQAYDDAERLLALARYVEKHRESLGDTRADR